MNRGPGRYRCVTYLKAWTHGSRDWADPHVRACDFCRPIAYGDGKRFIGTIHEEADRLRASRRRAKHTRRAFLAAGAASVLALATGVMWMNGGETRARSSASPAAPIPQLAPKFARFESTLRSDGVDGLKKLLKVSSVDDGITLLSWIPVSGHKRAHGVLAEGLIDSRPEIRRSSVIAIHELDHTDALGFLPGIRSAQTLETENDVKKAMKLIGDLIQAGP